VEELTTEQMEAREEKQIREDARHSIQLGKDLEKLRKSPEFKRVFDETFVTLGKKVLWENTQHLSEEQMKGRGSDRNVETIGLINKQIEARVHYEGFLDTIEHDFEMATEAIQELEQRAKEAEKVES